MAYASPTGYAQKDNKGPQLDGPVRCGPGGLALASAIISFANSTASSILNGELDLPRASYAWTLKY